MVKRALTHGQPGGIALGPQGRGIFGRLFGRAENREVPAARREARAIAIAPLRTTASTTVPPYW